MFLWIFGSNDFLQFVVLQFLFTQTTLWLSFNAPLAGGRGREREIPWGSHHSRKIRNVNKIKSECLRVVEAGWVAGKKQLIVNCMVWWCGWDFYLGLLSARQRLSELCLGCHLSLFSSLLLCSTRLEQRPFCWLPLAPSDLSRIISKCSISRCPLANCITFVCVNYLKIHVPEFLPSSWLHFLLLPQRLKCSLQREVCGPHCRGSASM